MSSTVRFSKLSHFQPRLQNCYIRPLASTRLSVHSSVCPSVRLERLDSYWMDFHQISYLRHSSRSSAEPNFNASSQYTVIAGEVQMTWRRPLLGCVLRLRSFPSLSNCLTWRVALNISQTKKKYFVRHTRAKASAVADTRSGWIWAHWRMKCELSHEWETFCRCNVQK
jgi:hypothetical protein